MFEEYQFAGVYIAIQAVLTLYAQGNRSPCPTNMSCIPPLITALSDCPVLEGVTNERESRG